MFTAWRYAGIYAAVKGECYVRPETGITPTNRHNGRYDLATLCQVTPELTQFLTPHARRGAECRFGRRRQ
ncbi:RlmF-related methyltransferase [Shigella flexneri]